MLTKLKSKQGLYIALTVLLGLMVFIFSSCAETTDIYRDMNDLAEIQPQSLETINPQQEMKTAGITTEVIEVMETDEENIIIDIIDIPSIEKIEIIEKITDAQVESAVETATTMAIKSEEMETLETTEAAEIMSIVAAAVMASVRDEPIATSPNDRSMGTLTALTDCYYVAFNDRSTVQTMDMRQKSNISEEVLREYLLRFPNLFGIAPTLIEAQEAYNVNAIMLLAIIRLESGNGQSRIAVSKNNLGGIVAPSNSAAVYRAFDSKEECVVFMAHLLSNQYLTEGGRFFSGYTLGDINKRYSVSSEWSSKIGNLMVEIQSELNNISEHLYH